MAMQILFGMSRPIFLDQIPCLMIVAGQSHPNFARQINQRLGISDGYPGLHSSRFSNGESIVEIRNSVRDGDIYIIQTACEPVNEVLMELLITISACRMASAKKITAVLPCFPYARQDKKDRSRAPISAKLVANMLEIAGCNHVMTMDLHASQIQGFFNIPVDNLYGESTMIEWIQQNVPLDDVVIVSPDAGGAKR
jgi:ribose-phosphate pyrophosphokinase